ncbi:MAG: amidohydrolase family protein [Geminicoccaceae bacterium]
MSLPDLLLRNVRPMGGDAVGLLVRDGRIAAMGPNVSARPETVAEDGEGALLLPGLIDAHTHLDKSFIGYPWQPNGGGPEIIDFIENERRLKASLNLDATAQSERQVRASVARGSTCIRSHVDVDPQVGVRSVEGVLATREKLAGIVDIQIVAFPQWGLLSRPGTAELMEEALRLGADIVGGLDPSAIDRDPKGQLDLVFALAERFGRPIDIHLHEPDHLGAFTLKEVCRRTRAHGMQGRVMLSHAFSLGADDPDLVAEQVEALATSGVAIMTTGPAGWPAPAVAQLQAAGVTICSGNDGMRDAWQPFGDGDMLARANAVAQRNEFRHDEELALALDTATGHAARAIGLDDYGLRVGALADFLLVDAETVAEAVASPPVRKLVVKAGRIVARDGEVVGLPN